MDEAILLLGELSGGTIVDSQ